MKAKYFSLKKMAKNQDNLIVKIISYNFKILTQNFNFLTQI